MQAAMKFLELTKAKNMGYGSPQTMACFYMTTQRIKS